MILPCELQRTSLDAKFFSRNSSDRHARRHLSVIFYFLTDRDGGAVCWQSHVPPISVSAGSLIENTSQGNIRGVFDFLSLNLDCLLSSQQ